MLSGDGAQGGVPVHLVQELPTIKQRSRRAEAAGLGEYGKGSIPFFSNGEWKPGFHLAQQAKAPYAPGIENGARGFSSGCRQGAGTRCAGLEHTRECAREELRLSRCASFAAIDQKQRIHSGFKDAAYALRQACAL